MSLIRYPSRLRDHPEHRIAVGFARFREQRLHGGDESLVFLRRQCVDLATFGFDGLI